MGDFSWLPFIRFFQLSAIAVPYYGGSDENRVLSSFRKGTPHLDRVTCWQNIFLSVLSSSKDLQDV
jgi:hypothetical protein